MKKILLLAVIVLMLLGCAPALQILDILSDDPKQPEPRPICDKDSVRAAYQDQVCLKFTDGSYRWVKK